MNSILASLTCELWSWWLGLGPNLVLSPIIVILEVNDVDDDDDDGSDDDEDDDDHDDEAEANQVDDMTWWDKLGLENPEVRGKSKWS